MLIDGVELKQIGATDLTDTHDYEAAGLPHRLRVSQEILRFEGGYLVGGETSYTLDGSEIDEATFREVEASIIRAA